VFLTDQNPMRDLIDAMIDRVHDDTDLDG